MADIQEITSGDKRGRGLSVPARIPPLRACLRGLLGFVRRLPGDGSSSFSCYIGDGEKQVEALYRNLCDLVIYLETGSSSFARLCSSLHVKFVKLKEYCASMCGWLKTIRCSRSRIFDIRRAEKLIPWRFRISKREMPTGYPWQDIFNRTADLGPVHILPGIAGLQIPWRSASCCPLIRRV